MSLEFKVRQKQFSLGLLRDLIVNGTIHNIYGEFDSHEPTDHQLKFDIFPSIHIAENVSDGRMYPMSRVVELKLNSILKYLESGKRFADATRINVYVVEYKGDLGKLVEKIMSEHT